jgi:hypothetical protein
MLTAVIVVAAFLMGVIVGGIGCFSSWTIPPSPRKQIRAVLPDKKILRYLETQRGRLRRLGYALLASGSTAFAGPHGDRF